MKVGDLVQITECTRDSRTSNRGVIMCFKSFEKGNNPQPIVLIDGKLKLYGESQCEVINMYDTNTCNIENKMV